MVVVVGYAMVLVGDPVASTGLPSIREGLDAEDVCGRGSGVVDGLVSEADQARLRRR